MTAVQFFATSKDVSIGPVAVMSLTVSQIIKHVQSAHPNQWQGPEIATTVAFISGFIVLGIGLLRLGRIVEFIPAPAVSGFMTGSAINIVAGQVPGLMGISGFEYVIFATLAFYPVLTLNSQHESRDIPCHHQYPQRSAKDPS
jgi:solute carrier family 26 (sodium-independent sulfate anion transporter), member 11